MNKEKLDVVLYCSIMLQVADVFTRPLDSERFKELREMLGVVSLEIELKESVRMM